MHSKTILSLSSWDLREPSVPILGWEVGWGRGLGQMEEWRVGEYREGEPGFCQWGVWGGKPGGLPRARGIGWLLQGQRDAFSIILQYLQYLHFHSLHQVDPGVVLSKLEHLPGPTYNHDPTDQDNPEASQHHHDLEHIGPDHSLHAALQDVIERGGGSDGDLSGERGQMGDLAGAKQAWPPAMPGTSAPLCLCFLICKMG